MIEEIVNDHPQRDNLGSKIIRCFKIVPWIIVAGVMACGIYVFKAYVDEDLYNEGIKAHLAPNAVYCGRNYTPPLPSIVCNNKDVNNDGQFESVISIRQPADETPYEMLLQRNEDGFCI